VDEEQKQKYYDKYYKTKQKGIKFFPDIIYKDLIVSFGLFLLLVGLAMFIGVASEPRADPTDTAYIPRPEWYFLFLFQMLKYFPGQIEWIGTTLLPGIAVLVLFLLPLIDRNPYRHWSKRWLANSVMSLIVVGMVALTIVAAVTTPPQEESAPLAATLTDQISAGQDLYSIQCVECHGADGEGGEIKGVEGLEGVVLRPINDQDVMYAFTDQTLYNIINLGQPIAGMPPFGKAYGGELSQDEINAIVTFMRYTWDDRAELPQEAAQAAALPTLAPNEVPSYDVHIAPVVKRYCLSCHRPGKKNNNFIMEDYNGIMTSGDHAPNVIAGDLNSNLIRMIHREDIDAGGPMPPTRALKPELVTLFEQWVLGGAPQTAEQAAQATLPGGSSTGPAETVTVTGTLTSTLQAPITITSTLQTTGTLTTTLQAPATITSTLQTTGTLTTTLQAPSAVTPTP
jgi:menaquinol-cytochrome c reductase cytochrome b/c subunit